MRDENYNNLADAVFSVGGINHDVTSGRWPLLCEVRREPLLLHCLQHSQEASL